MKALSEFFAFRWLIAGLDFVPNRHQVIPFVLGAAVIALLLTCFGYASSMAYRDDVRQADYQCRMVKLWHTSHHKAGWPPLNEWQTENCK